MKKILTKWFARFLIRKLKDLDSESVLRFYSHNVLLAMQRHESTEIKLIYTIEVDGKYHKVITTSNLVEEPTINI